jgi:transposase
VSQVSVSLSAAECQVVKLLLPPLAAAVVDRAEVRGDLVCIWARAAAGGAACPGCGAWCTGVHDRYERRLREPAVGGRRVLIRLETRLLACGNAGCRVGTFAEQPRGLAAPYARKTPPLARQLAAVARALAGRAGARLAAVLAVEVSRHTLVRILMAEPERPAGLVRVLGIDDFALRAGHEYATLLVDMEAGVPVDVLPDREPGTARAWLEAHPEVEVICRDRAGGYAEAARDGAPQAVQVADRWHLWHNLCGHVRDAVARHRDCLAADGCARQGRPEDQQEHQQQEPEPEQEEGMPAGLEAAIRDRHRAVHELRAAGKTQDEAAAALGLSKQLTGRYWRAADPGTLLAVHRSPALDPYKPYLRRRFGQGTTKVAALHREITARGYPGSYRTTYAWCALLKLAAPPAPPAPPAKQQVTRWMLTDPARLDDTGQRQLPAILARCAELDALAGHVTAFAKILTRLDGAARLDGWLTAAAASGIPELRSFANGIRKDHDAVANAVTLQWNSGRVEGLNTRTKLLKRQGYGRASFPLLRKRILLTS